MISFYLSLQAEHHSNNCCSQFKLGNTLPKGALMVEICTSTMTLKNDQQYGRQTGNNLKGKSRDINQNSSRFIFLKKNETMFSSGYENFRSLEF